MGHGERGVKTVDMNAVSCYIPASNTGPVPRRYVVIEVNEQGQPVLTFRHLRAGHWPGLKGPPWGVSELGILDLQERLGIVIDRSFRLSAVIDTKDTKVRVTLRHREDPRHDGVNIFAHPVDTERWTLDD
jgi:hypothetical protein